MIWERVAQSDTGWTDEIDRIKVEGGYLYRNTLIISGNYHVTMTFVPLSIRDSGIANRRKRIDHIETP